MSHMQTLQILPALVLVETLLLETIRIVGKELEELDRVVRNLDRPPSPVAAAVGEPGALFSARAQAPALYTRMLACLSLYILS